MLIVAYDIILFAIYQVQKQELEELVGICRSMLF